MAENSGARRRKRATKGRGGARRRGGGDDRGRIIGAALELAAQRRWRHVRLDDIARQAGLDRAAFGAEFSSKAAILAAFLRDIDDRVVGAGAPDAGETARDRLFDVLMRRFDALAPHKVAIGAIVGDLRTRPGAGLCMVPRFLCSMAAMLEAAGLSARGIAGLVRIEGLALIYANALRVWLADDSPDMAATMAALDKGLRQAERVVRLCRPAAAADGAPATA
jgi:AcrR family transcriptional regulator